MQLILTPLIWKLVEQGRRIRTGHAAKPPIYVRNTHP